MTANRFSYLTDRCNLDCSYCTEYDNSRPHPKLDDLELWIRKIGDLGTMRIALGGGEPLLHPDIVEIVRYCRELGFVTSLTTNGFLLTRKLLRALARTQDGFARCREIASTEFETIAVS